MGWKVKFVEKEVVRKEVVAEKYFEIEEEDLWREYCKFRESNYQGESPKTFLVSERSYRILKYESVYRNPYSAVGGITIFGCNVIFSPCVEDEYIKCF